MDPVGVTILLLSLLGGKADESKVLKGDRYRLQFTVAGDDSAQAVLGRLTALGDVESLTDFDGKSVNVVWKATAPLDLRAELKALNATPGITFLRGQKL